jgi:lipid-A-disaccharide synthase
LSFDVQFLVSAGEASGDMYAAGVVEHLRQRLPAAQFFGCAGAKLQAEGVEPVVDAADLSVVGLAEVVHHLPRIYGEYRKLVAAARQRRPQAALLTDNPDFHLRLARRLKETGTPVFCLVAPQAWAWRAGRAQTMRALIDKLFCLFPFEEAWFRERGVDATYIGHPLAARARVRRSRDEFLDRYGLPKGRRVLVLLPGSRPGEARRHLRTVLEAAAALRRKFDLSVVLATPDGFRERGVLQTFREPIEAESIQIIENDTWDAIGHADLALAASGTVTIEAAVLGTPMVTYYKVTPLSWYAGRRLVKVPFLSMVNLVAGRRIVPELMQREMTGERLVEEASKLLADETRADSMRKDLAEVRTALTRDGDPLEQVAATIAGLVGRQ